MLAPHRLAFSLRQRISAAADAIRDAQTPREQLDAQVDCLRALLKLAEQVDAETAAAITKGVVEGVSAGITEMTALIRQYTAESEEPSASRDLLAARQP